MRCLKCNGQMVPVFSTTELINGTQLAYLRLTEEYYVSPEDRAFMLHGTMVHAALTVDDDYSLIEEKLLGEGTDVTGIFDIYELEIGVAKLIDRKTAGSYKVAKALGLYQESVATGGVYKSGQRKGLPRTKKVTRQSDEHIDRWEWELQLNMYRIQFQRQGFPVHRLMIECIPRDGGTHIAKSRGVNRNLYLFDINILPDEQVLEYFKRKRRALLFALRYGWTKPCTGEENWEGIRCARFCEVAQYCPLGQYLIEEKEKLLMPIRGLSEVERPQISGKMRLGRLVPNKSGTGEHPEELNYFRIDPTHIQDENLKNEYIREFHEIYGPEPTMLNVIFPSDDEEVIFPQYYTAYGSGAGMKCQGDGETAECFSEEMVKVLDLTGKTGKRGQPEVYCKGAGERGKEETTACPYFKGKKCNRVARLRFLIPDLKGTTMWECVTGSINSIINVNSAFKHFKRMAGKFSWIPLQLMRVPLKITKDGHQRTHYVLAIDTLNVSLLDIMKYAKLDPIQILDNPVDALSDFADIAFTETDDQAALNAGKMAELPENVEDTDQVIKTFGDLCQRLAEDWNEDTAVIRGFLTAKLETEEKAYERLMLNISDEAWMTDLRRMFGQWVLVDAKIDDQDETQQPPPEVEEVEMEGPDAFEPATFEGALTYKGLVEHLCDELGIEKATMVTFTIETYGSEGKATLNMKKATESDSEKEKFEKLFSEWEKQGAKNPTGDKPSAQSDLPM